MWNFSYSLCASGWNFLTVLATPETMQVQGQACYLLLRDASVFSFQVASEDAVDHAPVRARSLDLLVEMGPGIIES